MLLLDFLPRIYAYCHELTTRSRKFASFAADALDI